MRELFSNRNIVKLILTLVFSCVIISGISIYIIFSQSIHTLKKELIGIVERQKTIVTVLHNQGNSHEDIALFIKQLRKINYGIGKKGEFAIAQQIGDSIIYLFGPNSSLNLSLTTLLHNNYGTPMRQALAGRTGFVKGLDYKGEEVYAAYTYVPELNWGIVAKIPTTEVYTPYLEAIIVSAIISVVLLSISVLIFTGISKRVVLAQLKSEDALREKTMLLESVFESAPYIMLITDAEGRIVRVNRKGEAFAGNTNETLHGLLCGDVLQCLNSFNGLGCGKNEICNSCPLRINVLQTVNTGEPVYEAPGTMNIKRSGHSLQVDFLISTTAVMLNNDRNHVYVTLADVTQRVQAEQALRDSEERYKHITEGTSDYMYTVNVKDGKAIETIHNDMCKSITGYTPQEFYNDPYLWINMIIPEERELVAGRFLMILTGENIPDIEHQIICKDGTTKWISDTPILKYDNKGNLVSYDGIIKDITLRKKVEIALRESEHMLKETQNIAKLGTYVLNIETGIWQSSELLDIIFGIDQNYDKSISGWVNIIHPEWQEIMNNYFVEDVLGKGIPFNKEYKIIRQNDREELWVHGLGKLQFNGHNQPVIMLGTIQDVTERKLTELLIQEKNQEIESQNEEYLQINEELAQTNDELLLSKQLAEDNAILNKTLLQTIPFGIDIVDELGFILYQSENLINLFGNQAREKKCWELYRDNKTRCEDCPLYADIQIGKTDIIESLGVMGGRVFEIFHTGLIFQGKKALLEVFNDITERKLNEQELVKAKEKAEESDRLKTAFLQNMSHEIRTPMNAIMGFSELIVKNFNNKPKLIQYSDIITQRCNDLLEIINDILEIAKIESGQMLASYSVCNINEIFSELNILFKEHRKRLDKQQIKLNFKIHDDLINNQFVTDKLKLKQIFINLISNAFKFTETGLIEGGCNIEPDGKLLFYVSDTGIGIPVNKQQIIFERFAQAHKDSAKLYGGTGLGLSIVKGLVNLLGGTIWLNSEPGEGTTFYFNLPLLQSTDNQPVAKSIDMERTLLFTKKNILLVEDDVYNAKFILEVLSETGLKIVCAENGNEGIELALNEIFDLVLMDIQLPDMSGYQAISTIKAQKPDLKIIAQTAYASSEDKNKAINAGCIDYISKPMKSNTMLEIIYKHLML